MNRNKTFKLFLVSLLSVISLSSCSLITFLDDLIENNSNIVIENTNSRFDGYTLDNKVIGDYPIYDSNSSKAGNCITMKDYTSRFGQEIFPSTGEQNLLVIPVEFKDYTVEENLYVSKEEARENIYNAFFGDDSNNSSSEHRTGWESLKSYYAKSSYGTLQIDGMVTDWYSCPYTVASAARSDSKDGSLASGVLRKAISWFKETYPEKVNDFDKDNDGYIDGVVLIYANPSASKDEKLYSNIATSKSNEEKLREYYWAYCTNDTLPADKKSPVASGYIFASYDFLWDGGYSEGLFFNQKKLVDAHTYIHEFGHLMGLDDYYSYDEDNTKPLGSLDMMDYNIGDHNAYSKYALGWYEPTLIKGEGEYEISALTNEGSALLIPSTGTDFTHSSFDEYLLIELYSPTGNNYQDAKIKYQGICAMYSKVGVRVMHVDSRIIAIDERNKKYNYVRSLSGIDSLFTEKAVVIGANNTPSYSVNNDYKLISLVSCRGIDDYFASLKSANNSDLYHQDDEITSFTFNNGNKLPYTIKVTELGNEKAKITITLNETK